MCYIISKLLPLRIDFYWNALPALLKRCFFSLCSVMMHLFCRRGELNITDILIFKFFCVEPSLRCIHRQSCQCFLSLSNVYVHWTRFKSTHFFYFHLFFIYFLKILHAKIFFFSLCSASGSKLVQSEEHRGPRGHHPSQLCPEKGRSQVRREAQSHAVSTCRGGSQHKRSD